MVSAGAQMYAPSCPRCGYDASGLVATWERNCPMQARCPECGGTSESSVLFDVERRGPAWSFEHGKRRMLRRWLQTGVRALAPGHLWAAGKGWRGLRPEYPVAVGRLLILAVSWLAVLHLTCGALVGLSELGLRWYGSPTLSSAWWWDVGSGSFWAGMGRRALWPYAGHIRVAVSANSMMSNPVSEFAMVSLVPHLAMAVLVWAWLRRGREGMTGHAFRGAVMSLPMAVLWIVMGSGLFVGAVLADTRLGEGALSGFLWLGSIAGVFATVVWWWRQFVVLYLGHRRRQWLVLPLGVLSFVATWFAAAGVDMLVRAVR